MRFWDTGQGWFERTGGKGAADRDLAQRILGGLSRELVLALSGRTGQGERASRLAALGPAGLRRLDLALAKAQEALLLPTAPAVLVLDWLATAVIPKSSAVRRRG
jgi:DNA polymerase-3 subunit delta'